VMWRVSLIETQFVWPVAANHCAGYGELYTNTAKLEDEASFDKDGRNLGPLPPCG
jgi:hypothetical protein